MTDETEIARIRAEHRPETGQAGDLCDGCSDRWPCDTAKVLAALDEAESKNQNDYEALWRVAEDAWQESLQALAAQVAMAADLSLRLSAAERERDAAYQILDGGWKQTEAVIRERDELRRLLELALSELGPNHYRRAEIEQALGKEKL